MKGQIQEEEKKKKETKTWISETSFDLLNKKARALRLNKSEEVKEKGRELRRSLRKDRKNRVEEVSVEIEKRLDAMDIIGAFNILRRWYKKFSGTSVKPSEEDLNKTKIVYENIFKKDNFSNDLPFSIDYVGDDVVDTTPSEEDIRMALFKMRNRKAP